MDFMKSMWRNKIYFARSAKQFFLDYLRKPPGEAEKILDYLREAPGEAEKNLDYLREPPGDPPNTTFNEGPRDHGTTSLAHNQTRGRDTEASF